MSTKKVNAWNREQGGIFSLTVQKLPANTTGEEIIQKMFQSVPVKASNFHCLQKIWGLFGYPVLDIL